MDEQALRSALPTELAHAPIFWTDSTDSTNEAAKRHLEGDIRVPFIVGSDTQTAGVGQRGHHFDSPRGHGLYLTLALPLAVASSLLMPAAGVAVAEAANALSGQPVQLKWVNDLFVGPAKVGGILTWLHPEQSPGVILGIGLNLTPAPGERALDQPTGALLRTTPSQDVRPALIGAITTRLLALLAHPDAIMPAYRKHARWVGTLVTLTRGQHQITGRLSGFADDGGVLIETTTGRVHATSGSLRPLAP